MSRLKGVSRYRCSLCIHACTTPQHPQSEIISSVGCKGCSTIGIREILINGIKQDGLSQLRDLILRDLSIKQSFVSGSVFCSGTDTCQYCYTLSFLHIVARLGFNDQGVLPFQEGHDFALFTLLIPYQMARKPSVVRGVGERWKGTRTDG